MRVRWVFFFFFFVLLYSCELLQCFVIFCVSAWWNYYVTDWLTDTTAEDLWADVMAVGCTDVYAAAVSCLSVMSSILGHDTEMLCLCLPISLHCCAYCSIHSYRWLSLPGVAFKLCTVVIWSQWYRCTLISHVWSVYAEEVLRESWSITQGFAKWSQVSVQLVGCHSSRGWDSVRRERWNYKVSRKKYDKTKMVVGGMYLYGNSRFCQG